MGRLVSRIAGMARRPRLLPAAALDRPGRGLLALALLAATLIVPASASAATPPTVTATSAAEVTETSATLQGKINSGGKKTEYRFEYITLAAYKADGESFGEGTVSVPSPEASIPGRPKATGDLTEGSTAVASLNVLEGALDVGQAISGPGIQLETTIAALGEGILTLSKPATATATVELLATGPQPVSTSVAGLNPGASYRLRIGAHNTSGPVEGQTVSFATLAPTPAFGPCPNDLFRNGGPGVLVPPTHPSATLPDCRAYEQVSPTEKNGADVVGEPNTLAAALDGQAVTFLSGFGMPGGEGSQTFPTFLASRSGVGWSSTGLLPPAAAGSSANLLGHTPDLAYSIAEAQRLNPQGSAYESALFLREGASGPPARITPYEPLLGGQHSYYYVGASASGREIFFESAIALPPAEGVEPLPGAIQGSSNVYAYETAAGTLSLATQMNSPAETEALLPHGAFAGPYDWARGSGTFQLAHGGAVVDSYTQDDHAVSQDGALFFTAAGSAQLYERVNPTAPQSQMEGGRCTELDKACTFHVSATHKTNSPVTEDGSDPGGPQPAAFMAASANGDTAFFTSAEKLTDDANTGPEQPPAQIGRAKIGEEAEEVEQGFLPAHALGMATSLDGEYLYWADPSSGTIDRAELNGSGDPGSAEVFVVPGETEAENFPEKEPGVLHSAPSTPRYVALGPCAGGGECVYWTNTGPLGSRLEISDGLEPVDGAGSIGRAELDGSGNLIPESVEPEFILGASNPQGIAVNSEHIYWTRETYAHPTTIARATLEGGEVEPEFVVVGDPLWGLALDESYLYFSSEEGIGAKFSGIQRIPLNWARQESEREVFGIGSNEPDHVALIRSLAVSGSHIYWASAEKGAIGRAGFSRFIPKGSGGSYCPPSACEYEYAAPQGAPFGLAADPSGERIYWSVNGEAPGNPGTDLYRFQRSGTGGCEGAQGCLTDLTADAEGNGGEAFGVLGASEDGSYVYFVANGALAEGASPGDCHYTQAPHGNMFDLRGHCNLYLAHAGQLRFIARLGVPSGEWPGGVDKYNWVPSPNVASAPGYDYKYPRQAEVSADGQVLSFLSSEPLTGYDSSDACEVEGSLAPIAPCPEYYRFDATTGGLSCLTCNPTGAAPTAAPNLLGYATPFSGRPGGSAEAASVLTRNLTEEGSRFFFQSTEALVGSDSDGVGGCPRIPLGQFSYPACQDVYEWEAPGAGSCTEANSSYSSQNKGCIYLLSPGVDARPALFADADETGDNAFFFTPDRLVGQDQDQLFDLYDARREGGLASQNPPAPTPPCEGEACKPGAAAAPALASPSTPSFQGPGNVREKAGKGCPKGKYRLRRHGKTRCVKRHPRHHRRHHGKHAHRRTAR
jgi:hypothetical protein